MSAGMSEGDRKTAMDALKRACQRWMDITASFDLTMNDSEERTLYRALHKARHRIIALWQSFPECDGDDQRGKVPPAHEILASIARQEAAIAWAAKLETGGAPYGVTRPVSAE